METSFEDTLARLEEMVGRLSPGQHNLVRVSLGEDEMGVWRIAARIQQRSAVIPSTVGAFISSLHNGEHQGPKQPAPVRTRMYPPLPVPSEEKAAHYRTIQSDWARIQLYAHHPEVIRLRRDLTLMCKDPNNPTDEEAAHMRETVLALIEIL